MESNKRICLPGGLDLVLTYHWQCSCITQSLCINRHCLFTHFVLCLLCVWL